MNYDIIGDIHGHAEALRALLASLGYRDTGGAWRHPGRQVLFTGDFIDRGPSQVETVDIVRRMVDAGTAQAVMGNHEFNAIAWFTPDPEQPGEYLRPHHSPKYGDKNYQQHAKFLEAVADTPRHKDIIDWFRTLPLWLDLNEVRLVHACWHTDFMDYLSSRLAPGNRLTEELLIQASREPADDAEKDTATASVFKAVEAVTKGLEINLPPPHTFRDKEGHERDRVRVRWWDSEALTFQQSAMLSEAERRALPDNAIPDHVRLGHGGDSPLFIGHYWLNGAPQILSKKVACVDYSVAKDGKLVAYRWDGEPELHQDKFRWV